MKTKPAPIKVSRQGYGVRKPPIKPAPKPPAWLSKNSAIANPSAAAAAQRQGPIIIHTYSPKIHEIDAENFMRFVQNQTGCVDTRQRWEDQKRARNSGQNGKDEKGKSSKSSSDNNSCSPSGECAANTANTAFADDTRTSSSVWSGSIGSTSRECVKDTRTSSSVWSGSMGSRPFQNSPKGTRSFQGVPRSRLFHGRTRSVPTPLNVPRPGPSSLAEMFPSNSPRLHCYSPRPNFSPVLTPRAACSTPSSSSLPLWSPIPSPTNVSHDFLRELPLLSPSPRIGPLFSRLYEPYP